MLLNKVAVNATDSVQHQGDVNGPSILWIKPVVISTTWNIRTL
jgi:hypothetical protein